MYACSISRRLAKRFTSVFAVKDATDDDLSTGWKLLDPTKSIYRTDRYSACPTLRFFGGWDLPDDLTERADAIAVADANGVPMGGALDGERAAGPPRFAVWARKDPQGANLDRIQIVKGWLDANGETQERSYTSPIWYTSGQEPAVTGAAAKHTNPGAG